MKEPKLLSGEEIVAKGATKASTSLPEIGLKDVSPNGSWLEQKQIQSALDARKHLIEVERIEKWGTLSHAVWREDLMLAEVTKQTGGYWQFLGHHREKVLYLRPEEALYLMEVNCLHLKYNEVTVSLQQAYTLLLRGQVTILQYKVYASLSRLGYKVFRFSQPKEQTTIDSSGNTENIVKEKSDQNDVTDSSDETRMIEEKSLEDESNDNNSSNKENNLESIMDTNDVNIEDICQNDVDIDDPAMIIDKATDENETKVEDKKKTPGTSKISGSNNSNTKIIAGAKNKNKSHNCKAKYLKKQRLRSQSAKDFHKYFENIPDLLQKDSVTILVPTEHLPDGVTPRYASYEVNLNNVRTKNVNSSPPQTSYDTNERTTDLRLEGSVSTHEGFNQQTYFYSHIRFQRQPMFNQFQFFRPRTNWNSFPYNIFFQRPFIRNTFFAPRFQFFPRQPAYTRPVNFTTNTRLENINTDFNRNDHSNSTNPRKRIRDGEQILRLNTIKNLASKLKSNRLIQGNSSISLVTFVQNLIKIYNQRYRARISLTNNFEIVENDNIVETITLDDDEVATKRPRKEDNSKFDENFSNIQELASKLKELEGKELATARHRRALSSVVRTFNESFNADIYVNETYEVIDRRHIVLDSSSDSDCVIEQDDVKKDKKSNTVGKKLRNPFNLLKNLSEKSRQVASFSKDIEVEEITNEIVENTNKEYSEEMKRSFKSWLPKSNDFGRAEIAPKNLMLSRIVEANKLTLLYEFIKNQTCKFVNWLDVKISFLENMEYAAALFHDEHVMDNSSDWNSIIKPEDCKDMPSVLSKLSIISNNNNNNNTNNETSLRIDFDVYNRDVQNFKKRNVPKPHFRVICLKQTSCLPPGPDITALHSRYGDVPIVFAIVGESISYVQINPTNLPMYIPEETV